MAALLINSALKKQKSKSKVTSTFAFNNKNIRKYFLVDSCEQTLGVLSSILSLMIADIHDGK